MNFLKYRFVTILMTSALLMGVGALKAKAADYFPLEVGNRWTYSPSFGSKGDRVDTIIGKEEVNGTPTYIWNRQEAPDDNYNEKRWIAKDNTYLKMYKLSSNEGFDQPVTFTPPANMLKLNPVVGDTWVSELDLGPFHGKLTFYVESTNAGITVAADTFNNCIIVQELSEFTADGVTEYDYKKIWYAPDVGPIIYRKYTENWASIDFSQELVSFSSIFNYAALWSENRYYESTNTSQYGMLGDTGVSTNAYDVFMYIPSWTGYEYQKLTPYNYFGSYGAYKFFTTTDGYPPPGGAYEAIDIYFFIDENGSGDKDSSDPSEYRYYQSGRFSQLPFVQNVKTSYSGSDVIVSWDGIPLVGDFGDDGNDHYKVRIIDKAMGDIVFDSGKIDINLSNKYVYNLGDLSAYGGNFWIAIEAREIIESPGMGFANRSRYYAEPNSKSKAQAMPWIPLLLLDD